MTTLNLGRVRPVYQGDWSSSATYEAMDFVRYNGSCYLAVKDVPANYIPTSQTTYWVLFAAKGDKGDQGVQGTDGVRGLQGETGPFFTPSVDASGNLSWTNDAGLDNPATVNIKGPKGDQGDPGEQGIPGNPGPAGTTDYTQLQNKPTSDTSLTVSGGFADAKATGDALATKVGVTSQSFSDAQKTQARTNIGWASAFSSSFGSAITAWVTASFAAAVDAYLIPILKQLCLDNGATQAEIDALENESDS